MTKEEILSTQYSFDFDEYSKNRVTLSYFKYGDIRINAKEKLSDMLKNVERCIDKYKSTKNTEYLIDAKNYLMFEFMFPSLDGAYFKATESKDSAGIAGTCIKEIEAFNEVI